MSSSRTYAGNALGVGKLIKEIYSAASYAVGLFEACAAGSGQCDFICDSNEVEVRVQMSAMTQSLSFGSVSKIIADFVPERVDNM
ncbi:predicted protein [Histoplasma mississippiense (nom. inval.)]|uniref:predicted protein n=1 Tax=Ajellomyces capsulatus (strain NAm1 / WU24) TaxID=2059318 RepID=UPI000157B378|nr:predicted protein [Histoplasma mississippiense (nom. inval.)]EDN03182.1 predicted protein [Histoplasma mississippiense (nom. inval.)]